jgi:hypothetical protein
MKYPMIGSLTLLCVLSACSPAATTPTPVTPTEKFSNNVVVNGDAEQGLANPLATPPVASVSGWTRDNIDGTTENATVETYAGFKAQWGLTIANPAGTNVGNNFFMGGVTALSRLYQVMDLSNLKFESTSARGYDFSALMGGPQEENDHAHLYLEFQKADGTVLETVTVDGPQAAQRNNSTGLSLMQKTGTLPKDAAKAKLTIEFDREFGTWNDGYVDNISLKFRLN